MAKAGHDICTTLTLVNKAPHEYGRAVKLF